MISSITRNWLVSSSPQVHKNFIPTVEMDQNLCYHNYEVRTSNFLPAILESRVLAHTVPSYPNNHPEQHVNGCGSAKKKGGTVNGCSYPKAQLWKTLVFLTVFQVHIFAPFQPGIMFAWRS